MNLPPAGQAPARLLIVMALVSSNPLMETKSSLDTANNFDKEYFLRVSLAISKALLPALPVLIKIAKSSESLKFSAPFSDSFSLGLYGVVNLLSLPY